MPVMKPGTAGIYAQRIAGSGHRGGCTDLRTKARVLAQTRLSRHLKSGGA
ncbi:hypothetical protein SAMN04488061_1631 [Filomicrobium insigne]|uniref:Uncharacterized protein n=1 Tax=Filomicrobium insigne TaxID=418854 RepID=A0A1H0MBX1_9HYPH|nr:hypothetical protein SAMN04488061_1631 [Filomicrobium insigne]